ncbi:MAG: alpha-glucosidase [Brevinema sp.]
MFRIENTKEFCKVWLGDVLIFQHSSENPAFFVGFGKEDIVMYRGNFKIKDRTDEKIPLRHVEEKQGSLRFFYGEEELTLTFKEEVSGTAVYFSASRPYSRFWMRVVSNPSEHIYGLGEQMSHFNLRGKLFPIWSSEPGVGRNKNTYITWQSDVTGMSGGDYWNTNYPQPSYLSSQQYYMLVDSYTYGEFDFRDENFHEVHHWEVPSRMFFWEGNNYYQLMEKVTAHLGRQETLPSWVDDGFILGIQGGWEKIENRLKSLMQHGVDISAVWAQDWQGIRMTSFGQRLMWNWQFDSKRYPDFKQKLVTLKKQGIRFLGYANCYLAIDGPLFAEAKEKDFLVRNKDGEIYEVDFGEFYCGIPDFTRDEVCQWFAERILGKEMLDNGLEGWMADFGEYLPTDCHLAHGSAIKRHNEWPTLWAKVNDIALRSRNKQGEAFVFMRAAGTYTQKYCPILWAGDQSVDFTKDDGLATVIPAALSSGVSGFAFHHSDLGGYTSLFGNVRTVELNLRWAEFCAFTGMMRSHETNRPNDNVQIYDSSYQMTFLARMVRIFKGLTSYRKPFVQEGSDKGFPLMRPIFFEYPHDTDAFCQDYQYLLGSDILVAPVWKSDVTSWEVYLPKDEWVHLWSGEIFQGGKTVSVKAPLGQIPAFIKKSSPFKEQFLALKTL